MYVSRNNFRTDTIVLLEKLHSLGCVARKILKDGGVCSLLSSSSKQIKILQVLNLALPI